MLLKYSISSSREQSHSVFQNITYFSYTDNNTAILWLIHATKHVCIFNASLKITLNRDAVLNNLFCVHAGTAGVGGEVNYLPSSVLFTLERLKVKNAKLNT